jgi:hypothetical protein
VGTNIANVPEQGGHRRQRRASQWGEQVLVGAWSGMTLMPSRDAPGCEPGLIPIDWELPPAAL